MSGTQGQSGVGQYQLPTQPAMGTPNPGTWMWNNQPVTAPNNLASMVPNVNYMPTMGTPMPSMPQANAPTQGTGSFWGSGPRIVEGSLSLPGSTLGTGSLFNPARIVDNGSLSIQQPLDAFIDPMSYQLSPFTSGRAGLLSAATPRANVRGGGGRGGR